MRLLKKKITILGGGSWGITLADLLCRNGHNVSVWEFSKIQAHQLQQKRQLMVMPHLILSPKIMITQNIDEACEGAAVIVCAVPSEHMRATAQLLADHHLSVDDKIIVSAAKGIENNSYLRMSEVISSIFPTCYNRIAAISGPSHAEEVSKGVPTAVVAASADIKIAQAVQHIFNNKYFRVYTNTDIIGVELGGSLKNILAIGCGICDGLHMGDNTKAALITRGLTEMTRFGIKCNAKAETFSGLSGIGDLVVTCTSKFSRNRLIGEKLGQGIKTKQALQQMTMVAEGVPTAKAVYTRSKQMKLELPITEQVYAVIYKNKNPRKAIAQLMLRKPKHE
ncbi:MAG: NAD(P)H-dependent glycerol-3-phosphate dehydrogenase [bacterium]